MTIVNYSDLIAQTSKNSFNVRDEYKSLSSEQLNQIMEESRLPYAVCAINITGDLNVSGIIRSAAMFGAERVLMFGRRTYDKRGTVGAQNYVNVNRHNGLIDGVTVDVNAFFNLMNQYKYLPIGVETGGQDMDEFFAQLKVYHNKDIGTYDVEVNPYHIYGAVKPCLIMGQEGTGIPIDILKRIDNIITIRQRGVMRSLNVASAASIVMYQMMKTLEKNT